MNIMISIKKVKKYFKDAKEVKSFGDVIFIFDEISKFEIDENKDVWAIDENDYYALIYVGERKQYAEIISYKDPLYKLTSKEVVHAYENPQWLKDTFKECFETELEVGKYFSSDLDYFKSIIYIDKIEQCDGYRRFGYYGIVNEKFRCDYFANKEIENNLQPATEKEVEEALQNYFEKTNGIKFNNYKFVVNENKLIGWDFDTTKRFTLFDNGVWNKIEIHTITEAESKFGIKIDTGWTTITVQG